MPPATGNSALPVKPAPCLPELPIGREELTVILNKSAANAVENATRMSVPQSEKAVLREMAREQPLPDYKDGWNELLQYKKQSVKVKLYYQKNI